MGAALGTDCRDLCNTQVIFKTPLPYKKNFILRLFCECGAGVGLNRSRRSDTGGRGGYASRSGAGTTAFLRTLLPKVQSSSLLQASSELGERRYNSGYLNYKSGHLCYNSAPESYKSGHSFYKTAVQATETPELCPVFNVKGSQGKITL